MAADKLKEFSASCPPTNPADISWVELDARLEKWTKHFGHTLLYCTIHALKLPVYFPRARTHLLRLTVKYNPDHGETTGRFFNLEEVEVMPIEQVAHLDNANKMNVHELNTLREESERQGRGVIVAAAIVCTPLAVQIMPFGSITQAITQRMKWMEHWERRLRECIATGNPNFGS
jgi:splicing suppressor protein 51